MIKEINKSNFGYIAGIRLHLKGYFSGYDDCLYIVDFQKLREANNNDSLDSFFNINFDLWDQYRTNKSFDECDAICSFWCAEITFSNVIPSICYASDEFVPSGFEVFLELMGVDADDENYYEYSDETDY